MHFDMVIFSSIDCGLSDVVIGSMKLLLINLLLFVFAFQGRALDNILPYFERDCPIEKEFQNKWQKNSNCKSHQEDIMGVPTQYLNDGSCLYMLAPAFSPPSVDCVNRWLLRDEGICWFLCIVV